MIPRPQVLHLEFLKAMGSETTLGSSVNSASMFAAATAGESVDVNPALGSRADLTIVGNVTSILLIRC